MSEPAYEVVWPLGKTVYEPVDVPAPVTDLNGKTICELWDWVFTGEEMFPKIREVMTRRYPGIKFVDYNTFGNTHGTNEAEIMKSLATQLRKHGCDAVISGIGG
ncbi:MAG: hypothetical protein ABID87_09315 [Chloroflexota bacterium]